MISMMATISWVLSTRGSGSTSSTSSEDAKHAHSGLPQKRPASRVGIDDRGAVGAPHETSQHWQVHALGLVATVELLSAVLDDATAARRQLRRPLHMRRRRVQPQLPPHRRRLVWCLDVVVVVVVVALEVLKAHKGVVVVVGAVRIGRRARRAHFGCAWPLARHTRHEVTHGPPRGRRELRWQHAARLVDQGRARQPSRTEARDEAKHGGSEPKNGGDGIASATAHR